MLDELTKLLTDEYGLEPSDEFVRRIADMVRSRLKLENKRKNLVGEGFEDVLGDVARRALPPNWTIQCRQPLASIPGFRMTASKTKNRVVDLVLISPGGSRTLATVKWSVRADREEQFAVDYTAYSANEVYGDPFDYVFITNEFDSARLSSACNRRVSGHSLFSSVVHVNPSSLLQVYGSASKQMEVLQPHLNADRLVSIETWLRGLSATS